VALQLPGITIVERNPHGASGAKYLPHGMDASSGDLNFIIRNDFRFPVRIEGSVHDFALFIAIYRVQEN
jgi:vancomycin resistance protein YoaR